MIYRKEIDGLRALAVLPVVFFHAGFEIFSGGYIGVDIFLVISGYLITSIIFSEQEKGCFSLLSFYERRARRILPALFLVIFISIIFSYLLMTPGQLIDFAESVIASSLFISNFHFLQEAGYFSVASELKPLLHTWSLAIEEQFYIFYPLILVFLLPFGRKITIIFLIFSFIFSLILSHFLSSSLPSANYYLIPTRAWELLMGCLAAFYLRSKDNIQIKNNFLRESFSFFGALVLFSSFFIIDNTFPFPSFWTLLPTLGTFLIIVYGTKETLTGRFLGNKIFVSLGLISYSLYLWHQPIFAFSRIIDSEKAKLVEKNPNIRNLNNFLTLKNSPVLNKYNFTYKNNKLALMLDGKELISASANNKEQGKLLVNKLLDLEDSLIKPISLLQNNEFPFYDTTSMDKVFNSISLINLNSIEDFEKKINQKVEFQRFRGNFYIKGITAWEERNWIGKNIKINNISFEVLRHIPRCVAINLKPKTDDNSLNLLQSLKKTYNHFDMGVYLKALDSGKVEVGNKLEI